MSRTWEGNAQLEGLLVPVGELARHPANPRRGDVDAIRASLRRFGQQRPVLALPDGTIVAGNHTWQAVVDEGWTHCAVVRSDLTDQEIEAYLVADNRHSDLGSYDDLALVEILMHQKTNLEGLGWSDDALAALVAKTDSLMQPGSEPPRLDQIGSSRDGLVSIVLTYSDEQASDFTAAIVRLAGAWRLDDTPSIVLESLRRS